MSEVEKTLLMKIRQGHRRSLAQAITLLESTAEADQASRTELLKMLKGGARKKAVRVGLTGAPGVGKSTLIEALGLKLIEKGKRVAVIVVDPASPVSQGAILADKTRMQKLAQREEAFIRPSSNRGLLGGVTATTKEECFLFEWAGYDVILIETVGIGQSETAVNSIADFVCLLIAPALGDDLQGMKRGIMELADLILVTKKDGAFEEIAKQTAISYAEGTSLGESKRKVQTISALTGEGIEELCRLIAQVK